MTPLSRFDSRLLMVDLGLMRYSSELLEGRLLKRYKRFFADVDLDGKTILAHVPNSGSMKGCNEPGSPCRVTHNPDPKRKLQYTLEQVKAKDSWVGVNTGLPNKLVKELFETKSLPQWTEWGRFEAEVKISEGSRIDAVLVRDQGPTRDDLRKINFLKSKEKFHFIEVKNVSLSDGASAIFPDSVTERGQKHLEELIRLKQAGHTCEMVFTIQRTDCSRFSPADAIDPEYGRLLRKAATKGIELTPLMFEANKTDIEWQGILPILFV